MPDCRYCGESFGEEEDYLEHLEAAHPEELGPIDRRRLGGDDDGLDVDWAPVALVGVLAIAAAIVAYVVFLPGGGSSAGALEAARTPHALGSVHYHGTMEVIIDGERVDFSRDRYQLQADAFHFEAGDGTRWHVHAEGVTLEYAMATLGIEVTADTVTFRNTTYRDSDPDTTVIVEVDGEPVTPSEYVLKRGDSVRIVVRVEPSQT